MAGCLDDRDTQEELHRTLTMLLGAENQQRLLVTMDTGKAEWSACGFPRNTGLPPPQLQENQWATTFLLF